MLKENKKILIVKLGAIGDVIMALPMITYMKKENSLTEIFWVCGKTVFPILKATNQVDHIIVVDEQKLLKGNFFSKIFEIFKIWAKIGFKSFNKIITAYIDRRYLLLTVLSFAKQRNSFSYTKGRKSLIYGRYMASEYLRLIDGKDDFILPSPIFPEIKCALSKEFLLSLPESFIVLAVGGSRNLSDDTLRSWPLEHYLALAYELKKKGNNVVFTGIGINNNGFQDFINFIDKLDLLQLLALYKRCALVITHDGGSFHLAKLAGCPVLGVFGPTMPHSRFCEDGKTQIIWGGEKLSCRPCYDGKYYAACTDNKCMKGITVERVLQEISAKL